MSRENELIASQALEIAVLKENNKNMVEALEGIHLSLICIGGPLNDNVFQYNKKQLRIFFEIRTAIEDIRVITEEVSYE